MKRVEKDVKSNSVVVGTAEYEVFDTLEEAEEELGTAVTLDLVNRQRRTDKMNEIRQTATGKPSKEIIRMTVMSEMTPEEFEGVRGDPAALGVLVGKKMDEYMANLKTVAPPKDDDEDAENLDEEDED